MSDKAATLQENVDPTGDLKGKGKGKAAAQPEKDVSMDTEDSSSEEELEEVFYGTLANDLMLTHI
jgi:hypothetical protein